MKIVIAGNHQQFLLWCRETQTNPHQAIRVTRPDQVRGLILSPQDIVRTGTWYHLPDIDEILLHVNAAIRRPNGPEENV